MQVKSNHTYDATAVIHIFSLNVQNLKMRPLSILFPVRNAEKTLLSAVNSLLAQDFSDFELILIEDGSQDRTAEIARKLAGEDARIICVEQSHLGIAAALNAGFKRSSGRYIARMDADDYSFPSRLRKQKEFLDMETSIGLVSCLVEFGGEDGGYKLYVDWINGLTEPEEIALNRFIESPVAHPSVMFRRSLVETFGGYDEGPAPEDYELWLRWMDAGIRMAKLPEVLLKWNDPPDRISRTHPNYSVEAFARVKAKYLSRWLERHNPFHPNVWVWGAGRKTRRRVDFLVEHGVRILAYLDVKVPGTGQTPEGIPVLDYRSYSKHPDSFLISMVNNRGVRTEIRDFLSSAGKREGVDFLIC
jgi:glycosyltransferase involved in cell wall biosynthesis